MADYRLSKLAESDLAGIADYAIENFGLERARAYRDGLIDCFHRLADWFATAPTAIVIQD